MQLYSYTAPIAGGNCTISSHYLKNGERLTVTPPALLFVAQGCGKVRGMPLSDDHLFFLAEKCGEASLCAGSAKDTLCFLLSFPMAALSRVVAVDPGFFLCDRTFSSDIARRETDFLRREILPAVRNDEKGAQLYLSSLADLLFIRLLRTHATYTVK